MPPVEPPPGVPVLPPPGVPVDPPGVPVEPPGVPVLVPGCPEELIPLEPGLPEVLGFPVDPPKPPPELLEELELDDEELDETVTFTLFVLPLLTVLVFDDVFVDVLLLSIVIVPPLELDPP